MRNRAAHSWCAALVLALAACGARSAAPVAAGKPATLVLPIERKGHYVLEFDNILLEVVPEGGKVVTFSIDGHNMLVRTHPLNFGSTVWPSPQSDWEWPPLKAIDSEPYSVRVEGSTIILTSKATSAAPRISLTKKFTPDLVKRAISIEYTLKNEDAAPHGYAIWEVTRVAPGGLTYFPINGTTTGKAGSTLEPTLVKGGYAWIDMTTNPAGTNKLHGDGASGFIAHTDGVRLFVKSWADVAAAAHAPDHGEVEFYDGDSYVELENQGPYVSIPAGQSITHKVRWSLAKLPAGARRVAEDAKLIEAARALASAGR